MVFSRRAFTTKHSIYVMDFLEQSKQESHTPVPESIQAPTIQREEDGELAANEADFLMSDDAPRHVTKVICTARHWFKLILDS